MPLYAFDRKAGIFGIRTMFVAAAASVMALASAAAPALAQAPPPCTGANMLEGMRLSADPDLARIDAMAAKVVNGDANFWRIEKDGVAPSYLLGTIHTTDPRLTALPEPVLKTIAASKAVAVEIAGMKDAATVELMTREPHLFVFTDGRSLTDLLSEKELAAAKVEMEAAGMPGPIALMMKPWMATTALAISACERKRLEAEVPVMDEVIEAAAEKAGIPVVGLETIRDQVSAMNSVTMDSQIAMLRATLAYRGRAGDLMETLIQLYLKRNGGHVWPFNIVLAEKIGIDAKAYDSFHIELLKKRNATMMAGARPLIDEGGAFIAVGALHVYGDDGLVKMLRDAGYQVTPAE